MGVSTDPIADMLTSIRNALKARHSKVDLPSSKLKAEIARVLKDEGFIAAYKVIEEKRKRKTLRIYLKYVTGRQGVITGLRRISKSGRRVYCGRDELRPVYGGLGINILTTPRGVMTGKVARREGVGGEILCEVW